MKINIINACNDLGVNVDGTRNGPKVLTSDINKYFRINNILTIEADHTNKNKDFNEMKKNLKSINDFNKILYNTVRETKIDNIFPVIIGGDHSITIGSALGSISTEENMGVIWIDSHADYNTFLTTKTGNIHGLPFATITGNNLPGLTEFHKGNNFYNPKNAVLIGGRDIDTFEMPNILQANIKIFTTNDLKNKNIPNIIKESIKIASDNTFGIHISCDIDILDPNIAPGVSVPANNGINENILYEIIDNLLIYKDKIKSFDLVEFNPQNDYSDKTKKIALKILEKVITKMS